MIKWPKMVEHLAIWIAVIVTLAQLGKGALAFGEERSEIEVADSGLVQQRIDIRQMLEIANLYLELGLYDEARTKFEEILASAETGSEVGQEAVVGLRAAILGANKFAESIRSLAVQKDVARLEAATRLIEQKEFGKALELVTSVLSSSNDSEIVLRAQSLWSLIDRNSLEPEKDGSEREFQTPKFLVEIWGWVVTFVAIAVFLLIVYWLLRLIRFVYWRALGESKWTVEQILDDTGLGISELVGRELSRKREQPSAAAGLLRIEAAEVPHQPVHIPAAPDIDPGPILEGFPQIAGLDPSIVANSMSAIHRWFTMRPPWIRGRVTRVGGHIYVQLTARNAAGPPIVITASGNESDPNAAIIVATEASFKMHYLLATQDKDAASADAADAMRQGLALVNEYLSGLNGSRLREALGLFAKSRILGSEADEGYLYEGVALDLLEEHDDAIQRFRRVQKSATTDKNADLKQKAIYNEAIARFRKYRVDELLRAEELLAELVGKNPNFENEPVKALAEAARANVIAHKLIFWREIPSALPETTIASEIIDQKKSRLADVSAMVDTVIAITNRLAKIEPDPDGAWDQRSINQLNWAIHNARGNAYLNCANNFLRDPIGKNLPTSDERMEFLQKAKQNFRECEVILPAGVETLTNLATTLSNLNEFPDAQEYAERAISLNPEYEYAYYRLAEIWERRNEKQKVVEVLESFKRPPRIREFQKYFRDYYIRPIGA